jgi:hypothetical protein
MPSRCEVNVMLSKSHEAALGKGKALPYKKDA